MRKTMGIMMRGLLGILLGVAPLGLEAQRPPRDPQTQEDPPMQRDGDRRRDPQRQGDPQRPRGERPRQRYSLEQACSDRAQLHTIAFSGLAFLTGDFGSATFIPPGKVADYFGFQYMRDIDAAEKGHNPMFLDRIAGNVLNVLDAAQRRSFEEEAKVEARMLDDLARRRWPIIAAFHALRDGNAGGKSLSRAAVQSACEDLFALDARLAQSRAKVFGTVYRALSETQRQALSKLRFGDFASWPELDREALRDLRPRGAAKLESVAFMTLASEFFSWVAGTVEADTYFCPERHGTYFGGFYLKDLPAMGKRDFDISTALTGDAGEAFLALLTTDQRHSMDQMLEAQRDALKAIVTVRRDMAKALRGWLTGAGPKDAEVEALGRRYGRLDGELAWRYATTFASIGRSLSEAQRAKLHSLRAQPVDEKGKAFLYSDRMSLAQVPAVATFFSAKEP